MGRRVTQNPSTIIRSKRGGGVPQNPSTIIRSKRDGEVSNTKSLNDYKNYEGLRGKYRNRTTISFDRKYICIYTVWRYFRIIATSKGKFCFCSAAAAPQQPSRKSPSFSFCEIIEKKSLRTWLLALYKRIHLRMFFFATIINDWTPL